MNSFGRLFRLAIFGESHGDTIGIVIDGCPPGITFCENDMMSDLQRRKSGMKGTTSRIESDKPEIVSGVFNGFTTGAPVCILFRNENIKSSDYSFIKETPRPGHADFVADKKYKGYNDFRGGGHFSGRLTLALVSAGVLAKKIIAPVNINSEIIEIGGSKDFDSVIENAVNQGDSVGGIIECRAENMPVGLGEPFFDSLESLISHLAFSIPAVKGIEFGLGFESARKHGSEVNDAIIDANGKCATNNSGGINGGISNGNDLVFRVAVKPASSITKTQTTINISSGKTEELSVTGRHDACIALRIPPVLEAVTAIAIADLMLISKSID